MRSRVPGVAEKFIAVWGNTLRLGHAASEPEMTSRFARVSLGYLGDAQKNAHQ